MVGFRKVFAKKSGFIKKLVKGDGPEMVSNASQKERFFPGRERTKSAPKAEELSKGAEADTLAGQNEARELSMEVVSPVHSKGAEVQNRGRRSERSPSPFRKLHRKREGRSTTPRKGSVRSRRSLFAEDRDDEPGSGRQKREGSKSQVQTSKAKNTKATNGRRGGRSRSPSRSKSTRGRRRRSASRSKKVIGKHLKEGSKHGASEHAKRGKMSARRKSPQKSRSPLDESARGGAVQYLRAIDGEVELDENITAGLDELLASGDNESAFHDKYHCLAREERGERVVSYDRSLDAGGSSIFKSENDGWFSSYDYCFGTYCGNQGVDQLSTSSSLTSAE